jgi:hypothetical protein
LNENDGRQHLISINKLATSAATAITPAASAASPLIGQCTL